MGVELPRSTDKETQTQSESAEQEAAGLFECEAVCKMQKHHSCESLVTEGVAKILKKKMFFKVSGCSFVIMMLIDEVNSEKVTSESVHTIILELLIEKK